MAIENIVSIDFDLCLLIVDNVFDCHLPGVYCLLLYIESSGVVVFLASLIVVQWGMS